MPTGILTYQKVLVHVLNVYESPRGPRATLKALEGEPFLAWTHGGWCYTSITRVPVALLHQPTPQE